MANQQTPERVTSDPVPVPPPADHAAEDVTDRVPEGALDDRGSFEDPVVTGERNDPDDLTAVNPRGSDFDEPPPQPTAFGAATVGGAVAAAAQAGPSREVPDGTGPHVEGAVDDRGPDADIPEPDVDAREPDVDTREPEPADTRTEAATLTEAAPAVEEPVAGLWGEGTAQGYRERWREVQLRFIDDPAAAAREANLLVEEAVGALTAELSRQKEELSGWSGEDTEELRAVVRRHRDFLDRLLGL